LKAALPALTGQLDDRSGLAAPSSTAAHLARCAFFQHLAAQKGLTYIRTIEERCGLPHEALGFVGHGPAECRDRMEAALDAIDALVDDPTQLPVLRNDLCVMIAQVQRLCAEEPRIEKSRDVHISAA
jgi:hypothetical protein